MFWFLKVDNVWQLLIGLAMRVFIILFILPFHEFAHGWAAYKLGDDTAKRMGRLTLNPIAHIDWLGSALMILVGFGWAKPVPVNPYNFRNRSKRKAGMALTALAGPVANLIAATASYIIYRAILCFDIRSSTAYLLIFFAFSTLVSVNVSLAVFNLIPIYPLDGSRILGFFLPEKYNDFFERNGRIISYILIALIMFGVLDGVLSFLVGGVTNGITSAVNWLFSIFGL